MGLKLILIACLLISAAQNFAAPHLPLEMSFTEYQRFYSQLKLTKSLSKDPIVKEAINGGEKMSDWIKLINANRAEDQVIRLTSRATQRGIPIDKPSKYGPSTILKTLTMLKSEMPKVLSDVIFGNAKITSNTLVSDSDFILWCRKVSKLYQTSVRWTGMQKWLSHYASKKSMDVRGFYFLKKQVDLNRLLSSFITLPSSLQNELKEALLGICINSSTSEKKCVKKLNSSISNDKIISYKDLFWKKAQKNWNSFFQISNPRRDISWDKKSPGVMEIVFKDPRNPIIAEWLKTNVEDEFRFSPANWVMEMRYVTGGFGTANLKFKRNVTPHVTGGNLIVMDANTELEEYGVKWTIRHEFGHILRLPDCYHEFYDKEQNLMINYQLDTTDLMCSRAGSMNERIFKELQQKYMK